MEPRSNNNTTTNAKKTQTLILAEDGNDRTLVFFTTISRGGGMPEKREWISELAWSRAVTKIQEGKLKPYDAEALQSQTVSTSFHPWQTTIEGQKMTTREYGRDMCREGSQRCPKGINCSEGEQ